MAATNIHKRTSPRIAADFYMSGCLHRCTLAAGHWPAASPVLYLPTYMQPEGLIRPDAAKVHPLRKLHRCTLAAANRIVRTLRNIQPAMHPGKSVVEHCRLAAAPAVVAYLVAGDRNELYTSGCLDTPWLLRPVGRVMPHSSDWRLPSGRKIPPGASLGSLRNTTPIHIGRCRSAASGRLVAIDVESPWLRVRIHSASPSRHINVARRPQNDAGDRTRLSSEIVPGLFIYTKKNKHI